jgi:glycosyltransferase involved in cell wall biosynthesis
MKKSVILRGPTLTQSGYGVHSRQVAKWLLNKPDIDVKFHTLPWGDTPWLINGDLHDGLIGQIMARSVDSNTKADVSIQLQLPNEWDPRVARYNVGITAGVETDKCNPAWINAVNQMDKVVVPSQHAKKSFENTGLMNKQIDIIPESYHEALVHPENNICKLDEFPTNFNFLIFGQLTGNNPFNDRKNTFFTLKWLFETFKDDKDVGIVIKTNAGRNTKYDRKGVLNVLKMLTSECKKGPYPRLYLLHGDMNDNEVSQLYRHPQIKALVSATRGEGYGLPILEAATVGLPVIATNWSGHLDFLNNGKFIGLDYKLQEVHPSRVDNKIFLKNFKWAEPLEEDFKRKVAKFKSSSTIPKEWAVDLSSKLKEKYSFDEISKQYDRILGNIF